MTFETMTEFLTDSKMIKGIALGVGATLVLQKLMAPKPAKVTGPPPRIVRSAFSVFLEFQC